METTLILVAMVCATIGYVAGVLITLSRREKEPPEEESTAEDRAPAPEAKREKRSEPVVEPTPVVSAAPRYDVAHLWREEKDGKLLFDINGRTYRSWSAMNHDQRAQLEQIELEIRRWMELIRPERGPIVPPLNNDQPQPVRPARPAPITANERAAAAAEQPSPNSIVAQINQILQDKLLTSPLGNRGISLTEVPGHGVVVWVGLEHFEGIDSVPDPEVKQIIRESVNEWENRVSR